jgi:site-specific recombinase XerD
MNEKDADKRLVEVIRLRHMALATESSYRGWLRRYIGFLKTDRHEGSREEKMERFLTMLAKDGVAASTQNQAFNAIKFFYTECLKVPLQNVDALRANRPAHVRTAPDRVTTEKFLSLVRDSHGYPSRLVTFMLYGMGLRLNEPLNLRIKDVDLTDSEITVRGAKGGKDRVRSIPCCLMPAIKKQIQRAQFIFDLAHDQKIPTKLPGGIGRKYPAAEHSFGWFWLFPSKTPCKDARDNGRVVWWHMHEANVQRSCKLAAAQIGMDGVISPHVLRHAWATHAMQAGANIKSIQNALGHVCLDTTAGYVHDSTQVVSPLDSMLASSLLSLPHT